MRYRVCHAQRAENDALPVNQGRTGIKTDPRRCHHQRVCRETRILQRIVYDHHLSTVYHITAESILAGSLTKIEVVSCTDNLMAFINNGNKTPGDAQ